MLHSMIWQYDIPNEQFDLPVRWNERQHLNAARALVAFFKPIIKVSNYLQISM
jgi:hypothetical protein